MNQSDLEGVIQTLFQQDLRFEVIIRAIVGVLSNKKNADGTPLITVEEVNTLAEQIKAELIEQARKPQLIVPSSSVPDKSATLPTPPAPEPAAPSA